jgi:NAD(P)-dependent dehydrogenase (short-subunit alcohol dehydrogenase family)
MASNGKVALVTGGGSGIGKASALALAREGFAVVVAGRRPEPLDAVVAEIEGLQGKALGVPTDVGDPDSAISPTMPRRKVSTQTTKMTPSMIVTHEPICAR